MKEYISTIIYICIFSIILELILPNNKLRKYVGVLVSLLIVLTLITPIINVLKTEQVTQVISSAIDEVQSKMSTSKMNVKNYDFSNLQNKLIFSSVRGDLENEIYESCNKTFGDKYKITRVMLSLNGEYKLENIDVYVTTLEQVANAGEIIDFIAQNYNIDSGIINVIKEEL